MTKDENVNLSSKDVTVFLEKRSSKIEEKFDENDPEILRLKMKEEISAKKAFTKNVVDSSFVADSKIVDKKENPHQGSVEDEKISESRDPIMSFNDNDNDNDKGKLLEPTPAEPIGLIIPENHSTLNEFKGSGIVQVNVIVNYLGKGIKAKAFQISNGDQLPLKFLKLLEDIMVGTAYKPATIGGYPAESEYHVEVSVESGIVSLMVQSKPLELGNDLNPSFIK